MGRASGKGSTVSTRGRPAGVGVVSTPSEVTLFETHLCDARKYFSLEHQKDTSRGVVAISEVDAIKEG